MVSIFPCPTYVHANHVVLPDNQGKMTKVKDILPLSLAPRGLSRVEAAAYVGVSPSLFDLLVRDGRMPRPKRLNSRTVWDRKKLDHAFELIPDGETLAVSQRLV